MNKIFLTVALCFCAISATAQVSVSSGNPGLDVKVKRAFVQGDNVYIDLIFTTSNSWTVIAFPGDGEFYDDEGNRYDDSVSNKYGYRVQYELDGKKSGSGFRIKTERNIPRKVRISIADFDEYASSFMIIKIPYLGDNTNVNSSTLVIKNLPVTR